MELVISIDIISPLLKGIEENLCKLSRVDCHLCSLVNDPGIILETLMNASVVLQCWLRVDSGSVSKSQELWS